MVVWWGVLRLKWINREEEIDGCSCDSGSDKQEEEKRREKKNIIIIIIPRSVARARSFFRNAGTKCLLLLKS
jgi:hypothetical protein